MKQGHTQARSSTRACARLVACALLAASAPACHHEKPATSATPDAGPAPIQPVTPLVATSVSTQFVTMDHMMAAFEMQLSGEPLAESMGRALAGYSREYLPPDMYVSPAADAGPTVDVAGFSAAVESYEYSKQPMNNLAFESGAGVSLAFGPLVNPTGVTGAPAKQLLQNEIQDYAQRSNATQLVTFAPEPAAGYPNNLLGWPGLWPTMHPYESFDPAIHPVNTVDWICSIASDDDPNLQGSILNQDYECDYNSLHLPDRASQIDFVITPGSSGWAGWKSALWAMNYLQIMHDWEQNPIASVAPSDLSQVGLLGNFVMGQPSVAGGKTVPGIWLGSSNVEGFQAAILISELDNAAQQWLTSLSTTDGATLTGFSSIEEALEYDFTSPLRWLPEEIAVTETSDESGFPFPATYQVQSSDSHLLDLLGLLGAYSELYALTDHNNPDVGGTQPTHAYFDGDPFPDDDQLPDGESTVHDRSLAMMRFVVVTLDRLHRDPATGFLADTVTFADGVPARGATIDGASVAYSLVALRNVRRSLGSQLALYSNVTPDTALASDILDDVPFNGAPGGASFSERLTALINSQASLVYENLTTGDGHAYGGWNFATAAPTDTSDSLDAYTAAVRGLFTAYLASGNTMYRDRAVAVFNRLDSIFWDPAARIYNTVPGTVATVTYTPRRFGLLQASLRDMYELVGATPGQQALGQHLQSRLARVNTLLLNGWDDRNGDQKVDWPEECINVSNGLPRGGLQMAERALSGETGAVDDLMADAANRVYSPDREHDCVPEISAAQLPSALADELVLTAMPAR